MSEVYEVFIRYGTQGSAEKLKELLLLIGCPNCDIRKVNPDAHPE